jgi:hypothetical protein
MPKLPWTGDASHENLWLTAHIVVVELREETLEQPTLALAFPAHQQGHQRTNRWCYRLLVPVLPVRQLEFKLTVHGRKESKIRPIFTVIH